MSSSGAPATLVLGAGVMGTAITFPLADSGGDITLVGTHLDADCIRSLRQTRVHPRLSSPIPQNVTPVYHHELPAALARDPGLVVVGVSSPGIPWAIAQLAEHLHAPVPLLLLTKGLGVHRDRLVPLTGVVSSEIAEARGWSGKDLPAGGVGGPCIAAELACRRETHVVMGAASSLAALAQLRFRAAYYHARYTADVAGVELSAALKNFFAIGVGTAAGMLERDGAAPDGTGGHNLAAALFAQAVSELTYLVEVLGGRADTAAGQAGTGDLYVTCQAGRNRRLGEFLGAGLQIAEAREQMAGETVEGVDLALEIAPALRSMMREATLAQWRLPLTQAILATVVDGAEWRLPVMEGLEHMKG